MTQKHAQATLAIGVQVTILLCIFAWGQGAPRGVVCPIMLGISAASWCDDVRYRTSFIGRGIGRLTDGFMLGPRVSRWLHQMTWILRPWRWSKAPACRGENWLDGVRTVCVACSCGKVFGAATDPRARYVETCIAGDARGRKTR